MQRATRIAHFSNGSLQKMSLDKDIYSCGQGDSGQEDEQAEDEWFFNAVKRYDRLFMYKLSCVPVSLALSDDGARLALVGYIGSEGDTRSTDHTEDTKDSTEHNLLKEEMLVVSLPDRLLAKDELDEGLKAQRDFRCVAGARRTVQRQAIQIVFREGKGDSVMVLEPRGLSFFTKQKATDVLVPDGEDVELVSNARPLRCVSDDSSDCCLVLSSVVVFVVDVAKRQVIRIVNLLKDENVNVDCGLNFTLHRDNFSQNDGDSRPILVHKGQVVIRQHDCVVIFRRSEPDSNEDKRLDDLGSNLKSLFGHNTKYLFVQDNLVQIGNLTHDGHRATVNSVCGHPRVKDLFFSTDNEANLHAWKFHIEDN